MILALDISLRTGWAYGAGDDIVFGTRNFSEFSGDCAVLGRRFHWWLADMIADRPALKFVAIEKPFFSAMQPGVGYLLNGLSWEANRVAEIHNKPRAFYPPASIKKHLTGNGRAKKPEVMAAVRALGINITNDHEADAVALLKLHERKSHEEKI